MAGKCWNKAPNTKGFISRPLEVRFWEKADKRGPDECWLWIASVNMHGRGKILVNNKLVSAPRVAWELHHGQPFPEGKDACHSCDNPRCVNPAHIWPGDARSNGRDMSAKGRQRGPGRSPVTPDLVRAIRERAASGERVVALAESLGLTTAIVGNIVARRSWKNVA